MNLEKRIFSIENGRDFEQVALEVFTYQVEHCEVYRNYVSSLGKSNPTSLNKIPFLPISFFKSHRVIADGMEPEVHFMSSGTGGTRSNHHVAKTELYERAFNSIYTAQMGDPKEQVILALLPNYLEQGNSSLVYMVDHLIRKTEHELSGFFLNDLEGLITAYKQAVATGKKVVIFGVSYALLDLAELSPDLSKATIIETGGMKGRRKEMTKRELHGALKDGLHCSHISSEYGMTELLSQAYSSSNGVFTPGQTMRVLLREVNDPFSYVHTGKTGGINVIDLANLYSCSFIETQDLGKEVDGGFEIMGRFDHSDLRGCNLMVV